MPLCIGLMSGTSMDGVDAVLCEVDTTRTQVRLSARSTYASDLRSRLLALQTAPDQPVSLRELAALDRAVAEAFAAAAGDLMRSAGDLAREVRVIGAHGQTVFHDPLGARNSLQLGDPAMIAVRCGVPVAADFRRADMALGGQGAPLVPAFHRARFGAEAPCAILNLGGIANLTLIAGDGHTHGFDTGPGNGLMDAWIERHLGQPFDRDGAWARTGHVNEALLQACLTDPYLAAPPPKSTGRDYFGLPWLMARHPRVDELEPADVQRTLCELTVLSVASSLQRQAPQTERLFACGGGRHNRLLMECLQQVLPSVQVDTTDALGLDGDLVEAAAFAWLGWRRIEALPGNLPAVTGATRETVLGGLYLP
ncbi:anhydro-N-acetylmuramic acid kinase [Sinimarinibacterium flocculans]|uniref:anhydro-N-acetylmuramic acid kinase n=1 Tax=Sinimarinibacterium flocculans TaxID=985250 RepID=UPI003518E549